MKIFGLLCLPLFILVFTSMTCVQFVENISVLLCLALTTVILSPARLTDNALICSLWHPNEDIWALVFTIVCLSSYHNHHNDTVSCATHRQCTVVLNVPRNEDILALMLTIVVSCLQRIYPRSCVLLSTRVMFSPACTHR